MTESGVRWVVLGLPQDGACTDLFQNLSEINLKGDLSNATTFNPPLFSFVNTFKMRHNIFWISSLYKELMKSKNELWSSNIAEVKIYIQKIVIYSIYFSEKSSKREEYMSTEQKIITRNRGDMVLVTEWGMGWDRGDLVQ
jgi:hypothetical protein